MLQIDDKNNVRQSIFSMHGTKQFNAYRKTQVFANNKTV